VHNKLGLIGYAFLFAMLQACGGGSDGGSGGGGGTATPPGKTPPSTTPPTNTPPPASATARYFAYVANSGSDDISGYEIDPNTGALTAVGTLALERPGSIAADPKGRFLYVLNRGGISSYRINPSTGLLSPAGSAVITGDPSGQLANFVTVDPSGRFVYVSNVQSNDIQPPWVAFIDSAISAYAIDAASGALTPVGTPVAGHMPGHGEQPGSLIVHPTGKFLFAAVVDYFGPGDIMSFNIDQTTGALTFASGIDASPYPTVLNLDPTGKFAYVTHEGGGESVSTYTIDPTTGALSFVSSIAAGPQPYGITVDPSSRFAYVTNVASDNLSTYTIDATTGALSATGTSVVTGEGPWSIAQDPTGKFLYVATADQVRAYVIDPATGALSSVAVAAGTRPGSTATTRTIE